MEDKRIKTNQHKTNKNTFKNLLMGLEKRENTGSEF